MEDPKTYDWRKASPFPSDYIKHNQTKVNKAELFLTGDRGCIVECDLEYPLDAKFKTSKFPLAPEKIKVNESDLSEYQKRCLTGRR